MYWHNPRDRQTTWEKQTSHEETEMKKREERLYFEREGKKMIGRVVWYMITTTGLF